MGCMLVGALLVGCDVQISQGSGGGNGRQPAGVRGGGPAFALAEVHQRAVSVKLKAELHMVRSTCEMYEADYGQYPDLASNGWSELTGDGYLPRVPTNPLSPKSVATKIIVTDQPGLTGADFDPGDAGWVFNTSSGWSGRMYAAGLSD
ncbi:MAG: type II secretion system protein [Planctomycetota bacterium]